MPGTGRGAIRRLWLDDSRNEHRRMAVSLHPSEGVAVFSVWNETLCRASFRVPIAELPRLVALLSSPVEWSPEIEGSSGFEPPSDVEPTSDVEPPSDVDVRPDSNAEPLWLVQ